LSNSSRTIDVRLLLLMKGRSFEPGLSFFYPPRFRRFPNTMKGNPSATRKPAKTDE
jgi:hypothetical protein